MSNTKIQLVELPVYGLLLVRTGYGADTRHKLHDKNRISFSHLATVYAGLILGKTSGVAAVNSTF